MQANGGVFGHTMAANTELDQFELNKTALDRYGAGDLPSELRDIMDAQSSVTPWDTGEPGVSSIFCSTSYRRRLKN